MIIRLIIGFDCLVNEFKSTQISWLFATSFIIFMYWVVLLPGRKEQCTDTWPRKPINIATWDANRPILNDLKARERRMSYSWAECRGRLVGSPTSYFGAPGSKPTLKTSHLTEVFLVFLNPHDWHGLEDRMIGVRFPVGIFLFDTVSRLVLGPTQPPLQWVPRGKEAVAWSYTSTPPIRLHDVGQFYLTSSR
jgi:hypothetical protein